MTVARHTDRDREIVFGRGALDAGAHLIGEGFVLLSTPRRLDQAPGLADRAAVVIDVPAGPVDEVAAALLDRAAGARLVAVGGGRVIDVAKAIAAARPPRTVVAIPTTLSGAEMTGVHRHARGTPPDAPRVRAAVVLNDPALSASAAVPALAASCANALGHALVAIAAAQRSPIAAAVAADAARRLAAAWAKPPEPDRDELALGALLCGWAVDHTGLGLHHVMTQSLVRATGIAHATANAALLPATAAAVGRRGTDVGALAALAVALRTRSGLTGIPAAYAAREQLDRAVALAADRPELDRIPPRPDAHELRRIYRDALSG